MPVTEGIFLGRSLTYRFASNAAIGWAMINGNSTLSPGIARRILSGDLKYFWENGCMGENGLLNIGYLGKNQSLAENYIVPGDPYFAMHGLCCLLLPENHLFWKVKEEPMPADIAGGKVAVEGAQFSLNVSPVDGDARLYPAGQPFDRTIWQSPVKYNQHAYSATIGFCLTGEGGEDIGAGRTGYSYDGKQWMYRLRSRTLFIKPDHIASIYHLQSIGKEDRTPEFQKDELITHTLIGNDGKFTYFGIIIPIRYTYRSEGMESAFLTATRYRKPHQNKDFVFTAEIITQPYRPFAHQKAICIPLCSHPVRDGNIHIFSEG